MKKWVVFDVMGVIFKIGDDTNELLVPFVQGLDSNIPTPTVQELYRRTSLGELSSADFWTQLGLGSGYPEIEHQYLNTSFTLDEEFLAAADQLREKYRLAILSNDVHEWASFLRKKYDLDKFFDVVVISGEAKYRKPDPRIFQVLLERTQAQAENCVFVDDKQDNVRSARALFFKTVLLSRQGKTHFPKTDCEIVRLSDLPDVVAKVFGAT